MGRKISMGNQPPKAPTTRAPSAPAPKTGGQAPPIADAYYGPGAPNQAKPTRSDRYYGHGEAVPGQADPNP